ncbi:MAG: hypothetical protein A3J07_02620 [Candidatus Doudnabacteria bacterium RIFCSPLOWO2_02_FULL_49_13]|uniref:Metallo-beta-lactamase domain-containing protein n=1 Tax=Candidatus Doudnabacteria bacterium RIFCSPHIGHO2_12_FULL_48_16 TaxID=1817838 RepID=A0A1F5PLN5_9BACT|nr:MAG: hypothetical protein A3B77_01270 [Candidatus Doudnabacteria bacterium RIFCSPHIGHO2_02_FULL_49_24]OGE89091.1 MAG: hypothetical protein A2760_02980 [Candidatus Doudnabacteria bacterium RIFCSPHIGHO2_01_FULL_50_67]OGE90572.1 MAG: hypothetical protein A3E29_02135 [Candidatus Doudnabacteria bacterium RIFCSPHIGHO2_12_FULL_48_16]OGE97609.1 MAG: hypothetical protein A2990_03190 [Candidatus Doudnabacteria bacterium RIFCSPLOWO2_01_FULL_49_40]OGF02964.1 MAG: hypothetical protein A3J07_02620 [Candid
MKITKYGHCCLLIEESGVRILTDPGAFSIESGQKDVKNVDIVLITHEHQDHLHIDSVKALLTNNPGVKIFTNESVGKLLAKESLPYELLAHGQSYNFKGVNIEGHGDKHAVIYQDYGQVENTGFLVADKLFYPGDAFYNPQKPVEILALPIAGPWLKAQDAIDYAKAVKPKKAFPVHDAIVNIPISGFLYNLYGMFLKADGIEFIDTTKNNIIEI